MIVSTEIEKAIQIALVSMIDDSDYNVIIENQNAQRPDGEYCTVRLTNLSSMSLEQKDYTNSGDDLELEYKAAYRAMVHFRFFKGDSLSMAGKVRRRLAFESTTALLDPYGISLAKRNEVKNLTEKLENGYEDRAGFLAYFNLVESDSETIGTIETVTISGSQESFSGTIDNFEIEITE